MHCFVEMLDKKLSCTCLSCGCPEAVVEDYKKKEGNRNEVGLWSCDGARVESSSFASPQQWIFASSYMSIIIG